MHHRRGAFILAGLVTLSGAGGSRADFGVAFQAPPVQHVTYSNNATDVIGHAFPGRKIVGLDASTLIRQHGSLHCVTMQLPKGLLA